MRRVFQGSERPITNITDESIIEKKEDATTQMAPLSFPDAKEDGP